MHKGNGERLILTVAALLLAVSFAVGQDVSAKPPDRVVKLLFEELCKMGCSGEEVVRWKKNLKFERHDLNGDSVSELFLFIDHSDWCGAGANCDYWIFQKTKSDYKLLLNDKELRVKDAVSNGYRDLVSETPIGFCGKNVERLYVTPYKYDGQKYRERPVREECQAFTPPPKS